MQQIETHWRIGTHQQKRRRRRAWRGGTYLKIKNKEETFD